MAGFHTQTRLSGYPFADYQLPVNLEASITTDHIGLAVTQDTSGPNKVKLAGDGDPIVGRLFSVENRTVEGTLIGTIEFHFAAKLPIKAGLAGAAVVGVGSRLVGAGAGQVKAIDPAFATDALAATYAAAPICWEVVGTDAVATKL